MQLLLSVTLKFSTTVKLLAGIVLLFFSTLGYTKETTILVFGDSISAAYGMEEEKGWVHLLSGHLNNISPAYQVINASVSGETTGGGVVRLPKTLAIHQPDLVILELGGNDGLRGYPIEKIRDNLNEMIRMTKAADTPVMLIGMVLPPNYGRRYTKAFEDTFSGIASEQSIPFVPFLLDGVATPESLLQRDGIHPKPEAQPLLLQTIWQVLGPMLKESAEYDPTTSQAE